MSRRVTWLCGLPVSLEGTYLPGWAPCAETAAIAFRFDERPPPARLGGEALLEGDGVAVHGRGGTLEVAAWNREEPDQRAWARVDVAASAVEIRSTGERGSTWLRHEVLPELVVSHLWPLHGVAYLHASGTLHGGRARLLLGSSGAGKSTAAALLQAAGDQPFCVDRAGVTADWASPAPFHGGAPASGGRAPLASLFSLDRRAPPGTRRLAPPEALACLAANAFLPRWWPPGLEAGLDLLGKLAERRPIDRLSSEPDERLVERVARASLGA